MWRRMLVMAMIGLPMLAQTAPLWADSRANAEDLCRKFAKMDQIPPDQMAPYLDQCVRDMVESERSAPAGRPSDIDMGVGGMVDMDIVPLRLPEP